MAVSRCRDAYRTPMVRVKDPRDRKAVRLPYISILPLSVCVIPTSLPLCKPLVRRCPVRGHFRDVPPHRQCRFKTTISVKTIGIT